jgi:hypothetical protein
MYWKVSNIPGLFGSLIVQLLERLRFGEIQAPGCSIATRRAQAPSNLLRHEGRYFEVWGPFVPTQSFLETMHTNNSRDLSVRKEVPETPFLTRFSISTAPYCIVGVLDVASKRSTPEECF